MTVSSFRQSSRRQRRRRVTCLTVGITAAALIFCFFYNLYAADQRLQQHNAVWIDSKWILPGSSKFIGGSALVAANQTHSKKLAVTQQLSFQRPDWPTLRTPTHHACDDYDGIYHVAMGDKGGAAGTIFFQFVIGQLIYAERNNLKPWVHFNNVSYVVYDPDVHGQGPGATLKAMVGRNATYVRRPGGHWRDAWPGPLDDGPTHQATLHFEGTGVWEHYFEPVSDFVPGDDSCHSKLYVTLDLYLITPGIHAFAPWATSCWRYKYLHDYITKPHIPINEWLEPRRIIGHETLNKYIRFKPYMSEAAQKVNPGCSRNNPCLGMHIRHSDKAAGRRLIETNEFLPYAQAFIHAGGRHIYLATDSALVLREIEMNWPDKVKSQLRTMGENVVRSINETAVFDAGVSHHRTNQEALIEILALSQCQYMIHGFSAMSESSIWINLGLHNRSVNLEDLDHIQPVEFGTLVQMSLRGEPQYKWPQPQRTDAWWERDEPVQSKAPISAACQGYNGILLISSVSRTSSAGSAFFTDVLNQLLFAVENNMAPWIHLQNGTDLIYDVAAHQASSAQKAISLNVTFVANGASTNNSCPDFGANQFRVRAGIHLGGNGIWNSYFEPISVNRLDDPSCSMLPIITIPESLISSSLNAVCTYTVKSWRYDNIAASHWKPGGTSLASWYGNLREKGHDVVSKYFKILPHILRQANVINPMANGRPCLGVHVRVGDKTGKYRMKVLSARYIPYLEAFVRAGGRSIFLASDSHRAIQYITKALPDQVSKLIRTQGPWVVRTFKEYPTHFIDDHHRVNSETLADIVALSQCSLLLHSYSTVSEAAIYLNIDLHNSSINLEDPDHLTSTEFEVFSRQMIGTIMPDTLMQPADPTAILNTAITRVMNASIVYAGERKCRNNAIVYLAQKTHSTYGRDSYSILLRSLDLLYENYLMNATHMENADVFIFHTEDFVETDLTTIEKRLGPHARGAVRLVNLRDSPYWARPASNRNDDPNSWYAYPLFKEGYRRMMHWYAIDIWKFFADLNDMSTCNYRYIFRLDEDSFIHSPIQYDIFKLFESNRYVYGYRMCAYEMKVAQRMWTWWKRQNPSFAPYRELDLHQCGFYNNMFVADLEFFRNVKVQRFLQFIDRQGHIYRRRLGDLMIHTMAVIAYAPPGRIHRFLDFTYEHGTLNETDGCLIWGGIQAGYADPNATATLGHYYETRLVERGCPCNATYLQEPDLSPTYAHVPRELQGTISLQTIVAGQVEVPTGKGILSG
ncbi:hypothetical protein MPSEU_000730700 [Mayamaea pseudoterrestris]|nr:hypothetical protein MPSEU_000730700 [Mayamaea pseudoterrestris]